MFRLHIDVPIEAATVEEAQEKATLVLCKMGVSANNAGIEGNCRLGNDDDRNRSNYFELDKAGHCSSRKSKIFF